MLTTAELRALSKPSARHSTQAILSDWLGIVLILALSVRFPTPWVWLPAMLVMGRQQLGLAILMHDGAHRRLFDSPKLNDTLGQLLLAGPLWFSMHSYRLLHMKHHKAPLAPDDPDISLTGGYPVPWSSFLRKLARDLTGVSYLKFIRYFIYAARNRQAQRVKEHAQIRERDRPTTWFLALSMLATNGLIFVVLTSLAHPGLFLLLWLFPSMSVLQVLLRIRGVAEHAGYEPGDDQRYNSRTVTSLWQAWWLAPHFVNYHIEHHLYPSVPFYNLRQVHQLMKDRDALPATNVFAGYDDVVRSLVR